jgi:hypothetical protein
MPIMKGQLTGMRGVYLVAAELSRRGFIASPTSRSARGADVLVTDQACRQAYSVQVKTNADDPSFWLVGQHVPVSDTPVYVLVNLRSKKIGLQPEFFVIPSHIVKERLVHSKSPQSNWYSIFKKDGKKGEKGIEDFKDKWDVFGDPHAEENPEITQG